jgi:hypothetical protein
MRCIYGIYGRGITEYTAIYGVYIRFWPTLHICIYIIFTVIRVLSTDWLCTGVDLANPTYLSLHNFHCYQSVIH